MHHFRLYFLDPDGRILRAENYSGDNDASAVAEAIRQDHPGYVEIWQGTRRAASINPDTGQVAHGALGKTLSVRSSMHGLS
ncbi:hypothetical protein Q4F19_07235 [Sphingomonas sp. BIUV-7]|uniref:DUF1508 domain-containing protein n=1 Tax=Sphingomonas natans TaxID=3063330 RepID=A0ABT8Y777_9SPHN|nr:hypothetical protein [Sphingomonas sp. BIUV-7]MDO6414170.1 hypothetical protein [Sphingomonas sp. BIUV-7]